MDLLRMHAYHLLSQDSEPCSELGKVHLGPILNSLMQEEI